MFDSLSGARAQEKAAAAKAAAEKVVQGDQI